MPPKILIIAPAWIGDMVMSQTLFKLLRTQYGDGLILDVLVNNWAASIVQRMPEVNAVHANPFSHGELALWQRIKLGFWFRQFRYDQVYVLPNSFKSALVPWVARIPKRIGWVGEMRYGLLNQCYTLDKSKLRLMIERFCGLATGGNKPGQIDFPQLTIDASNQQNLLQQLNLTQAKPLVCLCPAAEYGPAKRWPTQHFARLADLLQSSGYQVWILGSAKDSLIAEEIMGAATLKNSLHNLCGRTAVVDVIDLVALAKVVVTNDSGLMHVAAAVGAAVIAIYGSSSPQFTPPLASRTKIYQLDLDCSPCFARTCKFGHYNCLNQITPATIFQAVMHI